MSSEKRRRARVQGGWASTPFKATKTKSDKEKEIDDTSHSIDSRLNSYAETKDHQPVGERFVFTDSRLNSYAETKDHQPVGERFVFTDVTEELREKPSVKVIKEPGVYDISTEPSGVSRVRLFPHFIESDEAAQVFDLLYGEIGWKHKTDTRYEEAYLQPRLTAWFGEEPYAYAGVSHEANAEWTPTLKLLKNKVEDVTGVTFNSMLANCYRDNHDHIAWHSDNNYSLGPEPTIASLSFGANRNFEMRKNPKTGNDYTYSEHLKIPVSSGTLLTMEKHTQDDWQHRVPIEYHDRGPRINLTFRIIFPK